MSTIILTKAGFIKWLEKEVKEDELILMTQDINGTLMYKKRDNAKVVPFAFAANAFKSQDGVDHIAFGKTPVVGFAICKREDLSEQTLKVLKEG